jgi:hypothetical protein
MNPREQIIAKQIEWANNNGLQLTGSHGHRGRKVYTTTVEDNLFQPLNNQTKANLENGDGKELARTKGRPAKIQALHSSSALGINVFDYWRESPDLSIITSSCGLSRAGSKLNGEIRFEQQFSIDDRFKYSPNLDVVIVPNTGRYKAFACECKFTEAYSFRGHGGIDSKYFENDDIWHGLSETKKLAQKISPNDNRFSFLHVAQLIKHILGLNRRFGHSRYRFLYLWSDALGELGFKHRQEIKVFADVVRSDGVIFHETTYQDIIVHLAQHRKDHSKYVTYLTERYL